jgi:hypothetical protein
MSAWCQLASAQAQGRAAELAPPLRAGDVRPPRAVLAARLALHLTVTPRIATALRAWCRLHDIGAGEVVAEHRPMPIPPRPDTVLHTQLAPAPRETLRHRRMRLRRGDLPLACCDVWWLPGRMSLAMQAAFAADALPDGPMLQALALRRSLVAETQPDEGTCLVERRGLVLVADGMPVAAFREVYRLELPQPAGVQQAAARPAAALPSPA